MKLVHEMVKMKRGGITPDTLGMVVVIVGLVIVGFLMFVRTMKSFMEGFVASSAKVVAMDLSSLISLGLATWEVEIEYGIPTETVEFMVEVEDGYIKVQRIDETYCKGEQPFFRKVIGEKPVSEQEFCKASEPVLVIPKVRKSKGKKFVVKKVGEVVEVYAG